EHGRHSRASQAGHAQGSTSRKVPIRSKQKYREERAGWQEGLLEKPLVQPEGGQALRAEIQGTLLGGQDRVRVELPNNGSRWELEGRQRELAQGLQQRRTASCWTPRTWPTTTDSRFDSLLQLEAKISGGGVGATTSVYAPITGQQQLA